MPDINLCPKSIICLEPREGRVKADGGIDLVLCPSSRSDSPTSDGSTVPEQPRTRHLHTGRQAQVRASIKAPKRPQIVNKPTLIIFSIRQSFSPLGVIFHQHKFARRRVLTPRRSRLRTHTHIQVDISNANGKWTLTGQHITFYATHKF